MTSILIQFQDEDKAENFIQRFNLVQHGACSITSHEEKALAKLYIDIAILRGDVIDPEKHASAVKKLEDIASIIKHIKR